MQSSFSSDQNPHLDLLSLELQAIPSNSLSVDRFDLYVSLKFKQQWQSLLNGRIQLGLKGGELKLQCNNGEIALTDADFGDSLAVTTEGSPMASVWRLVLKTGEAVFLGDLSKIKLGTITTADKDPDLTAIFSVSPLDISLTDAEGLWRHDISPNKHAILERKLALFFHQTQCQPYVSWVKLGSQSPQIDHDLIEKDQSAIAPETLSKLEATIQTIYDTNTNDCQALIEMAGLNSLTDLAGGNFLATDLTGVELMGANLSCCNFRGAILTDAQLGEANLSYAKLTGADLSGAYLGNANLYAANLHRASLALSNLISANLREANLQEANLSNANLTSAEVTQAQFGGNIGISPEDGLNLQERGAIFVTHG